VNLIPLNSQFISNNDHIEDAFETGWPVEKKKAIQQLNTNEILNYNNLVATDSNYVFTQKVPMRDGVIGFTNKSLSLKERVLVIKRSQLKL